MRTCTLSKNSCDAVPGEWGKLQARGDGSQGPDWALDILLQPNHHFVIEYFFYMSSPAGEGEDQYLLWWNHEEALATESGVEYLTRPQTELYLIR